jgi:acyl transferase domain-containing protein
MTESPDRPLGDGLADAIAIVGMAGRVPGARTLDAFWKNLSGGVDSVTDIPGDELIAAGLEPELIRDPSFVSAKALLEQPELFDASFFGYNPTEATVVDPQQRVFLEVAWEALESAGYDPDRYKGLISVYAGMSRTAWLSSVARDQDLAERAGEYLVRIGSSIDFLTTRVSYKLNLRGPSFDVQTACSTSLVATCLACQAFLSYQCDMALAGGVSIHYPRRTGRRVYEGGIYSPTGRCRPFDASASGVAAPADCRP